jgi:hypothetical protein
MYTDDQQERITLAKLPVQLRWFWVECMNLANGEPAGLRGSLPPAEDIALSLHLKTGRVVIDLKKLEDAGLFERDEQLKRLVSRRRKEHFPKYEADRVKESRQRQKERSDERSSNEQGTNDVRTPFALDRDVDKDRTSSLEEEEEEEYEIEPRRNLEIAGGAGSKSVVDELWNTYVLEYLHEWRQLDTAARMRFKRLERECGSEVLEHVFIEVLTNLKDAPAGPGIFFVEIEKHRDVGCGYGWRPGVAVASSLDVERPDWEYERSPSA